MKRIIILALLFSVLNAFEFDFEYLKKAKEAYNNGNYKKAVEYYEKIKDKNDKILFNLADSYYKAKNYKKALELYEKIKDKNLEFKKLHNMGNTLAHLGKIDEAIKSYEEALKIKEDKDTRFNLELLKKMKKRKKKNRKNQKKHPQNQKNKNQNKKKEKKNRKNENQNDNKSGKNGEENRKNSDSKKKKENSNAQKTKPQKNQKGDHKDKRNSKNKKSKPQKIKNVPISDMEIRKYEKMLNKRGVNTLLLPLNTKGEERNEENIKPW